MRVKTILLVGFCVLLLSATHISMAVDQVMFNYQGRVKVQGEPFEGIGYFKFAIVNNSGDVTLWSNDGTSAEGSEPDTSVAVEVTDGIFNVIVGDPDLGMDLIHRSVFNNPSKIKLRIWFNDATHGFQRLVPDRRIINPELMGIRSGTDDFTIYVNGATGNDNHTGLKPNQAKKTIQAAVDILPERLHCNVTIDIADGIYREEVKVFGISVEPDKSLTFLGDESWGLSSTGDPSVRITGKDIDSASPVRDYGFRGENCSNINIKGIGFDYHNSSGTTLKQGTYNLYNCKAAHNLKTGFGSSTNAKVFFYDCVADSNTLCGHYISSNTSVWFYDTRSTNNGQHGIMINTLCGVSFHNLGDFSGNAGEGIHVVHNSRVWFANDYSGTIQNNGGYGITIQFDSYSEGASRNTFSGNTNGNYSIKLGGHSY